jgi:hypothetical protein
MSCADALLITLASLADSRGKHRQMMDDMEQVLVHSDLEDELSSDKNDGEQRQIQVVRNTSCDVPPPKQLT